jgi:membrane associated rhomboid family serine protease
MANCVRCGRQLPALTFGKKVCQWCVQHEAAQRGEDSPVQRVEPAPWAQRQSNSMAVTQAILGINVAVFAAMTLAVGVTLFGSPAWQQLSLRLGANYGPYTVDGQWWRLLACVFIHGGLVHIAFNMWCLWNLGRLAESVYGHWTFAAVYLITGIGASLGSLIWHASSPVPSVGASGAIFGIAGTLISSFYLGEFSLPRAAISGMLRSVVSFVAYNLVFGAMIGGIDNAAHVGGLLVGLLLGALIAKVAPGQDAVLRRVAVLMVGVLVVIGGALWVGHSSAYLVHGENGIGLLEQGKTAEGIAELEKSVRMRPNFAPAHAALADALASQHRNREAFEEYKRLATLDADYPGVYFNMGVIEARLKLYDDAISSLLKQKQTADDADNENMLAALYEAKGMTNESASAREKARQLQASH